MTDVMVAFFERCISSQDWQAKDDRPKGVHVYVSIPVLVEMRKLLASHSQSDASGESGT